MGRSLPKSGQCVRRQQNSVNAAAQHKTSDREYSDMTPLGLYLHIPFCVHKCAYCDFVSYAGRESSIQEYITALQQEIEWYYQHNILEKFQFFTLYIGGGTPSLATHELLSFLEAYYSRLGLQPDNEITIEVNPGTIRFPQFRQLRQTGINRVSIGVQSFRNRELRQLGRIHSAETAVSCFRAARNAGFQNISLDLMFGLPDSHPLHWEENLQQAISLRPEHISLYDLTIEEGTLFWQQQQRGTLVLPDEETQLNLYQTGCQLLIQAGYEQYEISNFALPGYRSRHNQIYWRNEDYIGLGAGAHSYLRGCRYWNTPILDDYMSRSEQMTFSQKGALEHVYPLTVEGHECLDKKNTIGETTMMNLRILDGMDLHRFHQRFGQAFETVYQETFGKLHALGLLEITEDRLRLTPRGILLSNEVFREFVHPN